MKLSLSNLIPPFLRSQPDPKPASKTLRNGSGRISASASGTSQPKGLQPTGNAYFEALNDSPDRTPISASATVLRGRLASLGRERLNAIGQWLYDNAGPVGYTVDTIANYSVPISVQPSTKDAAVNDAHLAYWQSWCERCDFTGRFNFDALQRLLCIALDAQADIGIALTAEDGFPQIQIFDSHRIKGKKESAQGQAEAEKKNGYLVIGGVRVDQKGRVLGYEIDDGASFFNTNEFFLLGDPERYSDYRHYSPLRRGMNDIRDAQDIKGFEKLAAKVHSSLVAVLTGGPVEEDTFGFDTATPAADVPDSEAQTTEATEGQQPAPDSSETPIEKKLSLWDLLGGDIPVVPNGQGITQLDNTRQSVQVADFVSLLVGWFVMGCGLPPSFILDEKLTGPNQRAVNGKAQRKFDNRQALVARLVIWVYRRVIAWGIVNDNLPVADGWESPEWNGPAKVTIDAGRETAQEREDVDARLMSRQNHFANRNLSWKRETDQQFHEDAYIIDRAIAQAKQFNLPPEMILQRWGFEKPKANPAPGENNQTKP